jgi:hypothetical protein
MANWEIFEIKNTHLKLIGILCSWIIVAADLNILLHVIYIQLGIMQMNNTYFSFFSYQISKYKATKLADDLCLQFARAQRTKSFEIQIRSLFLNKKCPYEEKIYLTMCRNINYIRNTYVSCQL